MEKSCVSQTENVTKKNIPQILLTYNIMKAAAK
jgi:hypothetical protein